MIRKFVYDDIDEIMVIWLEGNLTAHNFIDANYWHANYRLVRKMIPSADIYVYEAAGRICGFVGVYDGYLEGLFVREDCRSRSIGSLLVNRCKENYDKLSLNVYEKNHRAVKFYIRQGFHIESVGVDRNTGEKEYLMTWEGKH